MGVFAANYTDGKLFVTKEPIIINGVTYDPDIHKEDVKGFKWFRNKIAAYNYYYITME